MGSSRRRISPRAGPNWSQQLNRNWEPGKIFGSVSAYHVAEAIKNQLQVEVDRRKITIVEGEVKTLGNYTAEVGLGSSHKVTVDFEVTAAAE